MSAHRDTWQRLGDVDPLWAVLSYPDRRGGRWDEGEFLETADSWLSYVYRALEDSGLSLGRRTMDFGCGVGRLSNRLADQVDHVVGVDIAESMIDRARGMVSKPERIDFVAYDGVRLPFPDGWFDSVVSLIVLQHIPKPAQLTTILELLRVVKPGGVLAFQVPSRHRPVDSPDTPRAEIEVLEAPHRLEPGEPGTILARVHNRGQHAWPSGANIKLGNHWWSGDRLVVLDDGRTELPNALAPGDSVEMPLQFHAPGEPGDFELELDVVQEFVAWWGSLGSATTRVKIAVGAGTGAPTSSSVAVDEESPRASKDVGGPHGIEMHPFPRTLMESFVSHAGAHVVLATEVPMAGEEYEDFLYVVQRLE